MPSPPAALAALLLPLLLAGPAPAPTPSPTPVPSRWEGLERRIPGLVLFKKRWDRGVLAVKDGTVAWVDAKDESKNVLVPVGALLDQDLACAPGIASCTWTLRTKRTEYVFREEGGSERLTAAAAALLGLRPALPTKRTGTGP